MTLHTILADERPVDELIERQTMDHHPKRRATRRPPLGDAPEQKCVWCRAWLQAPERCDHCGGHQP